MENVRCMEKESGHEWSVLKKEGHMKIIDTKINGIKNPVGFAYEGISCSWKVADTIGKAQEHVVITVAEDDGKSEPVLIKEGKDLSSLGEQLDISLKARTRYCYTVEVTADNGDYAKSEPAFFETGKMGEPWEAEFIRTGKEDSFHPVFYKEFSLSGRPEQGRIYITGLGLYEAYLNGEALPISCPL